MPNTKNVHRLKNQKTVEKTDFQLILIDALHRKKMDHFHLSLETEFSQSYISRVERGQRSLTEALATKFESVLGGCASDWLDVYNKTVSTHTGSVKDHILKLFGTEDHLKQEYWGTRVRQLRDSQIIELFGNNDTGEVTVNGVREECEIDGFDQSMVSKTSYDMTAGSFATKRNASGKWELVEATSKIRIPPKTNIIVGVRQFVTFPSWLEAEFSPASNIVMKPLHVSNGPVIDPGWKGLLKVPVYNPVDDDVFIELNEAFLTLRFWVAEESGSQLK